MIAFHTADTADALVERAMLTSLTTACTVAVVPVEVRALLHAVRTECDGYKVTEVAKSGVFIDFYVTLIGNNYPTAVGKTLLIITKAKICHVEAVNEECGVGNVVVVAVVGHTDGIINTARRISALGTGGTVNGVITVESTVFAIGVVPIMQTFVAALGAIATLCDILVRTIHITSVTTVLGVPHVLAGITAVTAATGSPPTVLTSLTADRTDAVRPFMIAGLIALRAVAINPLVLTVGRGSRVYVIKLETCAESAEVGVSLKGYLVEV